MTFGQALRAARLAAGWTQEDLADATGTSRGHLSCIEHHHGNTTTARLEAFAWALGATFVATPTGWSVVLDGKELAPGQRLQGA